MNGQERRTKAIRTIHDSSSEPASQSPARPSLGATSSRSGQNLSPTTPRTKIRLTILNTSASSSLEIPETQLDPQPTSPIPPFSITVPPAPFDQADYETLRSSQINSQGEINFSSSQKPPLSTFQQEPTQSSGRPESVATTSPLTTRKTIVLNTTTQDLRSGVKASSSSVAIVGGEPPLLSDHESGIPTQSAQPVIDLETSSSNSSKFGAPAYISSTEQSLSQGRSGSIELGPESGSRRGLSIADLVCPEKTPQAFTSEHSNLLSDPQSSIQPNTYPQTEEQHHLQPSQGGSEPALHHLNQGSPVQNLPAGESSSPWEFCTQYPVDETPVDQPRRSVKVSDLISSDQVSPLDPGQPAPSTPSPRSGRPDLQPRDTPSPLRTQLRQINQAILQSSAYSRRLSKSRPSSARSEEPRHPDEMDMSGASNVTSPAAAAGPQAHTYDIAITGSALPIQNSIEDEQLLNDDQDSEGSKGSSSQQSLGSEREIPQANGLVIPSVPLLGPDEYTLGLPAEGKIQSIYSDIIKAKKKAILKFINRHEAIGSATTSPSRTNERNEMSELIQRLHDTTTHMDLGLPGTPTQYSVNSEEHAAYANYAGSKFSLLGSLVEQLNRTDCSIAIAAQSGRIQDLLEQYLSTKKINVKRHDRVDAPSSSETDRQHEFEVELISTMSRNPVILRRKPIVMIAFDASFDAQDREIKRVRAMSSPNSSKLVPVVHLLVTNSSEHVDLCIPKSLPSPTRLKLLVRTTYQARANLGGKPTYVPSASDEPQGRAMDFSDFQKALRKSPERKLSLLASLITQRAFSRDFDTEWGPGSVPELQLSEIDDISPKVSGTTTVAETPKDPLPRSRTPTSRADTPSGKKRLLEVENPIVALNKRQRLTPTPLPEAEMSNAPAPPPLSVGELNKKLRTELAQEKDAREKAEKERDYVKKQSDDWRLAHAALLRRYETRKTKSHELEKEHTTLLKTMESKKTRQERTMEENAALKEKLKGLQQELSTIREAIKSGGGDAATTEIAREEARTLLAKNMNLEKVLENTRKDFEFTREQYQNASSKAAEFAAQVRDLEEEVMNLSKQASDEKRRLKEVNHQQSLNDHLSKIAELEQERRTKDVLLKKLEEENRQLKRNRGVQTRGSSVQPPGSPGLEAPSSGRGPRSRQGSPAPGLLPHHGNTIANRGSLLRHER